MSYDILFFDTETTGLPNRSVPLSHPTQPYVTQIGAIFQTGGPAVDKINAMVDEMADILGLHPDDPLLFAEIETRLGTTVDFGDPVVSAQKGHDALIVDSLIKPDRWPVLPCGNIIGKKAIELTGITPAMCEADGNPIEDIVDMFMMMADNADFIVAHNIAFDKKLLSIAFGRLNQNPDVPASTVMCGKPLLCTMQTATPILKLPKKDNRTNFKWPKLEECIRYFYNEQLENAHSAIVDIKATRRVFNTLVGMGCYDEDFERFEEAKKQQRLGNDPAA